MRQRDVLGLPDGLHLVEPNLYIRVRGKYRNFIARLRVDGERKDFALGSANSIPISVAQAKLKDLKAKVWAGKPVKRKKTAAVPTFGEYAPEAVRRIAAVKRWKNAKHAAQWASTIETYAVPVLGEKLMTEITREDVLAVLEPMWEEKTETASRLRGRLEAVFDLATSDGILKGRNPAVWRGNLALFLPLPSRVKDLKHQEALTLEEAKHAAEAFSVSPFSGQQAVLFGILTCARVGEFLPAMWDEIDLEAAVWACPPERRKDGKPYPHRVPLCRQLVDALSRVPKRQRKGLVFPSRWTGGMMSIDTPRTLLRKFFKRAVTMHGCRSTFRDWAAESGVDWVLAEKSLMHQTGSAVVQAYQRSDLLEQRRPVLQQWADVLLGGLELMWWEEGD